MRFIKLLLSLLLMNNMSSCTSQSNFDLSEIRIPYESSKIVNENFIVQDDKLGLKHFKSNDEKLLVFDKLNFKKELSQQFHSQTNLNFFIEEKLNKIKCIHLETFVKEDGQKLYTIMLNKFGKPKYYNKDDSFFNGIWEVDTTFFLLKQNLTTKIGEQKTIKTQLIILQNNNYKLFDYFLFEGLNYYNDFLKIKLEKQDPNYTYEQFAQDKKNDFFGEDKYVIELINNLPL